MLGVHLCCLFVFGESTQFSLCVCVWGGGGGCVCMCLHVCVEVSGIGLAHPCSPQPLPDPQPVDPPRMRRVPSCLYAHTPHAVRAASARPRAVPQAPAPHRCPTYNTVMSASPSFPGSMVGRVSRAPLGVRRHCCARSNHKSIHNDQGGKATMECLGTALAPTGVD